jgi:hypothetical protein
VKKYLPTLRGFGIVALLAAAVCQARIVPTLRRYDAGYFPVRTAGRRVVAAHDGFPAAAKRRKTVPDGGPALASPSLR